MSESPNHNEPAETKNWPLIEPYQTYHMVEEHDPYLVSPVSDTKSWYVELRKRSLFSSIPHFRDGILATKIDSRLRNITTAKSKRHDPFSFLVYLSFDGWKYFDEERNGYPHGFAQVAVTGPVAPEPIPGTYAGVETLPMAFGVVVRSTPAAQKQHVIIWDVRGVVWQGYYSLRDTENTKALTLWRIGHELRPLWWDNPDRRPQSHRQLFL